MDIGEGVFDNEGENDGDEKEVEEVVSVEENFGAIVVVVMGGSREGAAGRQWQCGSVTDGIVSRGGASSSS